MVEPKKKRGRGRPPSGGRDPLLGVRFPREMIAMIDAWRARNGAGTRSAAIRLLVESALADRRKSPRKNP